MDNAPTSLSRWEQTAVCLAILGAVAAGFAVVDLTARCEAVTDWMVGRQLQKWKTTNSKFQYDRGYIDFEGRLLYDELPAADYSRGGVYFLGASQVKNSLLFWDLPPEPRKWIHNYALSGSGPQEWRQFLRFLIEEDGLLRAGGEKTVVIAGLFYPTFRQKEKKLNEAFVQSLFLRHGLYEYSSGGLRRARLNPLCRWYRMETARCANFLHFAVGHMMFRDKPPLSDLQKREYYNISKPGPGEDVEKDFAAGVESFARMVDELQARNVRVAACINPMGSWYRGAYGRFVPGEVFRRLVLDVCKARGVSVLDLEDLLTDEEFFDAAHANYAGQKKMHPYLVEFAMDQLRPAGEHPSPMSAATRARVIK